MQHIIFNSSSNFSDPVSNHSSKVDHFDPFYYNHPLGKAVDWIIICVGLPAICLAICALFRLVRADYVAPIYVINLLISDFLQIAITAVFIASRYFDPDVPTLRTARSVSRVLVRVGLVASLGFMVLISLERYLVVAYAVWYRYHRTIRLSLAMSLAVWGFAVTYAVLDHVFSPSVTRSQMAFSIISLLPAPFLLLFCMATVRVLCKSQAVHREERRKVIGALALVLGIYGLFFLPCSLRNLYYSVRPDSALNQVSILSSVITSCLLYLSPLADPFLYIFMRRDVRHSLDSLFCCRRLASAGRRAGVDQGHTHTIPTTSNTATSI